MDDEDENKAVKRPKKYNKHQSQDNKFPPGTRKMIDRLVEDVDPIVSDLAKSSGIDLCPIMDLPIFDHDILFEALLVSNHPKILEAIKQIRKRLKIIKLFKYEKSKYNETGYHNSILDNLPEPLTGLLEKELSIFFSGVGGNLQHENWQASIATWILTGILPLPVMPLSPFELLSEISEHNINELKGYPVIVIKKRINQRELNKLIIFLKESENDLVRATANLPEQLIKRKDADLTKLAIGLWINKLGLKTTGEFQKWADHKEIENADYFGQNGAPSNPEVPRLKADALFYLDKLCSFLTSSK